MMFDFLSDIIMFRIGKLALDNSARIQCFRVKC